MSVRTERRAAPDLQGEYEDLLHRYENLRTNAEEVVRENKMLRQQPSADMRSTAGVFPIILAFMVLGRLSLHLFVGDSGSEGGPLGVLVNLLFAGGAVVLLIVWVRAEWVEISWLALPKFVLALVPLLVAASTVSDGALLHGDWRAPATHPILAGLIAVIALLAAASPLAVAVVSMVLRRLNDLVSGSGGE